MTPLSELRPQVERMTVAEFCAANPYPYLVVSVVVQPLTPVDRTHGLTIDRVIVPASDDSGKQATTLDDYVAAPIRPLATSRAKEITIGCSSHCDVRINDHSVSKLHAYLIERQDGWRVEDARSLTGTRVNDEPPSTAPLASGDRISIGLIDLVFLMPAELYHFVQRLDRIAVSKPTTG